jgi:predicted GNAT family acetyltransferase
MPISLLPAVAEPASEQEQFSLDRPIWSALTTAQRQFAEGNDLALRYQKGIAMLAAMADGSRSSFAALNRLLSPGEKIALATLADVAPPGDLIVVTTASVDQMVGKLTESVASLAHLRPLGAADVADMMALVELTKPGPFDVRTYQLGRYLGVRVDGALVAMAGERLHLHGYTEISAVCCHPAHRGRGYAQDLMVALSRGIFARGERPFLHVLSGNHAAIALYRKLNFTLRRKIRLNVFERVG